MLFSLSAIHLNPCHAVENTTGSEDIYKKIGFWKIDEDTYSADAFNPATNGFMGETASLFNWSHPDYLKKIFEKKESHPMKIEDLKIDPLQKSEEVIKAVNEFQADEEFSKEWEIIDEEHEIISQFRSKILTLSEENITNEDKEVFERACREWADLKFESDTSRPKEDDLPHSPKQELESHLFHQCEEAGKKYSKNMQESLKKLQDYKSSYQKEMSVEAFEGIRRGLIDLTLSMISAFEEEITETTNKIEEVRLERSKKDSKLSA